MSDLNNGGQNKLLKSALWYAGTARFAVYPAHSVVDGVCTCGKRDCHSPGKHPRCDHGHLDATRDCAAITAWWTQWPNANVFIATGEVSDILVLDIDPKHGGDDSLRELTAKHGELPETPQVITGSLGMHAYFRWPVGDFSCGRRIGVLPGVDILGNNGGVIAPPSIHASRRNYVWEVTHRIDEIPIAEAPAWLLDLGKVRAKAVAAGAPEKLLAPEISEGGRNAALASLAGVLRRYGADEDGIVGTLLAMNEHRCKPPLAAEEVRGIARSICRYKPTADLPSKVADMRDEDAAALGLDVLGRMTGQDAEAVGKMLTVRDDVLAIAAAKRHSLPDFLSAVDRLRPKSLAARVQAVVRDAESRQADARAAAARSAAATANPAPPDTRPAVDLSDGDLESAVRQSVAGLSVAVHPPAQRAIYRRGGGLVRVVVDGASPKSTPLTDAEMLEALHHALRFYSRTEREDGSTWEAARYPPHDVARSVLARPDAPFPRLSAVYGHPVLIPGADDSTIPVTVDTYHAPRGTLVLCGDSGLPATATREEALAGLAWIRDEVLVDFPFASDPAGRSPERAIAFALLFLPFIRPLIDGPTPLHLIDASTQGSGKTHLSWILPYAATGGIGVAVTPKAQEEEEWRKRITAYVAAGTEVVVVDNVCGKIESDSLASVLTSTVWSDRWLGLSKVVDFQTSTIWVMTGNNAQLSTDIARRVVRCRLVPRQERPWERSDFRHKNLRGWLAKRRKEYHARAWACVAGWAAAGAPILGDPIMGSYEAWSQIMGGLLKWLGVPDFLANRDSVLADNVEDTAVASEFVGAWAAMYQESDVASSQILNHAINAGVPLDMKASSVGQARSLTTWIGSALKDKCVDGWLVEKRSNGKAKAALWGLRRAPAQA